MVRRYPCQIVIMFVLGILLEKGIRMLPDAGRAAGLLVAAASAIAALAAAGIWVYRKPAGRRKCWQALILSAAFGSGMGRMYAVSAKMERFTADAADGQEASVQGRIVKKQYKEVQEGQWTVHIADSYLSTSQGIRPCGTVIVYFDQNGSEPVIGNTIYVFGKIKLFSQARNDGNFDARSYNQNLGYSFALYADGNSIRTAKQHTDRTGEFLYRIRRKLLQVYEGIMPKQEAGALSAMLLGEKSLLSGEMKDLYRQSGIAHILAISGLHITVLGAAVFGLLKKAGVRIWVSAAAAGGLLILFALMTGMAVSAVRAVVMFCIYLGAACCGRAYDSVNGLAAAAAVLLMQNPCVLFLAGFQFSFAAVLGVLYGKELCRIFQPKLRLAETVLISFGIQLLTLPLTAWYYYEIPVYSVLLNLLVLPFMELVLTAGLAGGMFGVWAGAAAGALMPVFAAGQLCRLLSDGMLAVCTKILQYFSRAGTLFLKFPGAVYLCGRPGAWQMAGYYLILGICAWRVHFVWRSGCGQEEVNGTKR